MPAPDLSSFKVAASEVSSATKFNNLVQAIQDEFSDIDADQIPGYPSSVAKYLRGDGAWAGDFTTYTPAWTSTGAAPALGNGTITGRYIQIGKLVWFQLVLTIGTTTTFGAAAWKFSLPVTCGAFMSASLSGRAFDTSLSQAYALMGSIDSTFGALPLTLAAPGVFLDGAVPFAWASTDTLTLSGTYEAA